MELYHAKKYQNQNGKYPFPSDDLPQQAKEDKKYYKQAAQAILAKYVNDLCEISYRGKRYRYTVKQLRDFASGSQGDAMYKNWLIGYINQMTGKRPKSTINIDWTLLDILPKKLGDVKGYMQKLRYEVVTSAIDPYAVSSKDMAKAATKLTTNEMVRNLHIDINNAAGGLAIDPSGQLIGQAANAIPFQNEQQVDGFSAAGGFQLLQEIAMKILLDKTDHDSVSSILDSMLDEDLLVLGICGKKHYCEPGSDTVLWDHKDIENSIIPWSKYADYRDATWFGSVDRITIARLRKESNLTDEEVVEIAKKYNTAPYNKNSCLANFDWDLEEAKNQGLGLTVLDSIMVDIADVEWIGNKTTVQTSVTRKKEGNLAINTVDEFHKLSDTEKQRGKRVKKYSHQTVYRAKLIVGTDYVYDYGIAKDISYREDEQGRMCPIMSFNFYKLTGPSLVERCIGFLNDANMALLKKRMIMKNMVTGPNIKINKSAFENVRIDGKDMQPSDLMALFRDEGFLIVDDKNPWGGQSSSSRPIDTIPSDIAQRLLQCRDEMEWNIRMIEEITGLNAVFSASTPKSETGLGVAKIAINATENSIYTIIEAKKRHKEAGYKICAEMWKVKARYMDDSKRENFATDRAMNYIRIGKEIAWHQYGIILEAGVTEEEKLMLMQKVTALSDFRRQAGTGGIKPSDELLMFDIIRSGNIKLARLILAQIEEYRADEDERIAQQRYQENAQLQQQSNEQASQNKLAEIETEGQIKGDIEMKKIQAQLILQDRKARDERKLAALQNVWGWSAGNYNKTVKN